MAENLQFREIQEDLQEYFKDTDDKTFIAVCDVLVFHMSTNDSNISSLATKFLEDNGLNEAYVNYIVEMDKPSSLWLRHVTDIEMIENIKRALLGLSYMRMRKYVRTSKPKEEGSPLYRLSKQEKKDLHMVISYCERENNNLLDDEDSTRKMFDEDEANELVTERKRLAKLFTKVLNIIK